jgi:hypothetical protein
MFPTGSAMAEQWFRPGEQVPASGVFVVVHIDHRPEHEVILLSSQTFPACSVCGDQVRFRVVREVNISKGAPAD